MLGGFMAVGKSTVGKVLAQRLGLPFVDLDQRVEELAGTSVAELFATAGEGRFRSLEVEAVERLLVEPDAVVALGGGTLHHADNLPKLAARYPIVVLDLPWEQIESRLQLQTGRPLASQAHALWAERQPLYARVGRRVDLDGLDPQAAADAVMAALC